MFIFRIFPENSKCSVFDEFYRWNSKITQFFLIRQYLRKNLSRCLKRQWLDNPDLHLKPWTPRRFPCNQKCLKIFELEIPSVITTTVACSVHSSSFPDSFERCRQMVCVRQFSNVWNCRRFLLIIYDLSSWNLNRKMALGKFFLTNQKFKLTWWEDSDEGTSYHHFVRFFVYV